MRAWTTAAAPSAHGIEEQLWLLRCLGHGPCFGPFDELAPKVESREWKFAITLSELQPGVGH